MGGAVSQISSALGPLGTAFSILSSVSGMSDAKKQEKAAKQTAEANTRAASEQAAREEAERNKRLSKTPNVPKITSANMAAGAQQTMLTGPTGVDPRSLSLGRNVLLGQ